MAPPPTYDRDDPSKVDWLSLPRGWQISTDTARGDRFFVDHLGRATSWFHPRQLKHENQLVAVQDLCRMKVVSLETCADSGWEVSSAASSTYASSVASSLDNDVDSGARSEWLAIRAAEQMCKELGATLAANEQNERSVRLALQLVALRTDFWALREEVARRLSDLELDGTLPDMATALDYYQPDGELKTDCELKV